MEEIRANTELPSLREEIELFTEDGQVLVGELALPADRPAASTIITLHPLPTGGGFMDSHILRKAANRLPAMIGAAVLRFNTRGTSSPRGQSTGSFSGGTLEHHDVSAAIDFCKQRGLPKPWLLGWSFGTELAIKYGPDHSIEGAILLSPPLHRANRADLERWNDFDGRLIALIPELDDYLRPAEAVEKFAAVPKALVLAAPGVKHLWVGEVATRMALDQVAEAIVPGSSPLPTTF